MTPRYRVSVLAVVEVAAAYTYTMGATTGSQGWLDDHNYYRCQHGADPIVWDDALEAKAQTWADYMLESGMVHSDSYSYPNSLAATSSGDATGISGDHPASGENLAWAMGSNTQTCDQYTGSYNQACAVYNWCSTGAERGYRAARDAATTQVQGV